MRLPQHTCISKSRSSMRIDARNRARCDATTPPSTNHERLNLAQDRPNPPRVLADMSSARAKMRGARSEDEETQDPGHRNGQRRASRVEQLAIQDLEHHAPAEVSNVVLRAAPARSRTKHAGVGAASSPHGPAFYAVPASSPGDGCLRGTRRCGTCQRASRLMKTACTPLRAGRRT